MLTIFSPLVPFVPLIFTLAVVVLLIWGCYWLLLGSHPEIGNEKRLPRQLVMVGVVLAGVVLVAFALPVTDTVRKQVIALIGVLLSGVVAFASTTIVANFMAGLMLRMNKPFRTGDFIRVGEHFGRVSERGMLDTEIQSEHRELIALPNTYLIANPVVVTSASGAIVSVTLSLGYDVHHARIESLMLDAAKEIGLAEPFVQILELGDFSVSYRISGLLSDVKSLLTTRSNLYRALLDGIHAAGVEIVSPTVVSQRRLGDSEQIVPPAPATAPDVDAVVPEAVVFDKAEQAEKIETRTLQLQAEIGELEVRSKASEGVERQRLEARIKRNRDQLTKLADQEADRENLPERPGAGK